ncbi:MAG: hypothetical protein Q8R72_03865 [Hylemonella sp.]|nr:hypothetical protein [Hylemonella sp.]
MNFNIAYMGPEWLFHLRRDFILVLKHSLEDLGHRVILSGASVDSNCVNLVIGAYFLNKDSITSLMKSEVKYVNVNTEIIGNDMLNHNPAKVDFLGGYMPMIKSGLFAWDVVQNNIGEYEKYGTNSQFLRWGFHPKMRDISHRATKDLDYYFFGMMSPRRKALVERINAAGFKGEVDHSCPYFLRNDRIARAKVQLNIIQDSKYSHVNSFRICYLANNNCYILSEPEDDPAGYLKYADIADEALLIERMSAALERDRWRDFAAVAADEFETIKMTAIMDELLDASFSRQT